MLEPVGIFAISPVSGTSAWFHIGCTPGFRTESPEKGGRIKRSGALFRIIRLGEQAVVRFPKMVEGKDDILECHNSGPQPSMLNKTIMHAGEISSRIGSRRRRLPDGTSTPPTSQGNGRKRKFCRSGWGCFPVFFPLPFARKSRHHLVFLPTTLLYSQT